MPQQLIYTSAPRGLSAGRSGFCTVAMTAGMREALALQIEQLSYFEHAAHPAGQVIRASRVLDVRGTRYFVLSRVQDCGLDFTQRTNFIAQHLVFSLDDLREVATAPEIFRRWDGWITRWEGESRLLPADDSFGNLFVIPRREPPARHWARLSGDAANGFALVEKPAAITLDVNGVADDTVLELFAESLALIEARERRDFRSAAWQFTFTTAVQAHDSMSDFRWRCVRGEAKRFPNIAGAQVTPLAELRPSRLSVDEASFARSGYQPPKICSEPKDVQVTAGQSVKLSVSVTGVPAPARFQWFSVSRSGAEEAVPNGVLRELEVVPALGITRYAVQVWNARGDAVKSRVVQVSASAAATINETVPRRSRPAASIESKPKQAEPWQADPLDVLAFQARVNRENRRQMWMNTGKVFAACALVAIVCVAALQWFRNRTHSGADKRAIAIADVTNEETRSAPSATTATNAAPGTNVAVPASQATNSPTPEHYFAVVLNEGGVELTGRVAREVQPLLRTNSSCQFLNIQRKQIDTSKLEPAASDPNSFKTTCKGSWLSFGNEVAKKNAAVRLNWHSLSEPQFIRLTGDSNRSAMLLVLPQTLGTANMENGQIQWKEDLCALVRNSENAAGVKVSLVLNDMRSPSLSNLSCQLNVTNVLAEQFAKKRAEVRSYEDAMKAVDSLTIFRDAVMQQVHIKSLKGKSFWGEIEILCQLAAGQDSNSTPFGFETQDISAAARKALERIKDSGSMLQADANKALSPDVIKVLAEGTTRGSSIDDEYHRLRKRIGTLKDEMAVRLSKANVSADGGQNPVITFTLK